MKLLALMLSLPVLFSCNNNEKEIVHDDDYVLVEFASKLEESHHQMEPKKTDVSQENKEQ